jgi:N-acetylmuramoyl-L-alanine amidase
MRIRRDARVLFCLVAFAAVTCPLSAQSRPVVAIDAGHGGAQDGVVHEGWLEKELVLEIAFVVGAEFARAGWDVVFTRTTDVDVEWPDRRRRAEEAGADVLIMLHAMGGDGTERGGEVYFDADRPRSAAFATAVGGALERTVGSVLVDPRDWDFLSSEVPTAMIEIAHMGTPSEAQLLRSTDFHHELGRALVRAAEGVRSGAP